MNTITIETIDGPISYTEAEVVNFIARAKEVSGLNDSVNAQIKTIRDIRNQVRDFFSEGEWQDGEQTVNKGEVNDLLERIGSNKLTTQYRGTFTITGSFNIEVEDEDEVEDIIVNNTEISNWSADMCVDDIEIHDVEEDN